MGAAVLTNNIGYLSKEIARAFPDRTAIIDVIDGNERQISYHALESRLNKIANMLCEKGFQPGDRLAIGIGNRMEFIEVLFGAMRAGVVAVPFNIRLSIEVMQHIFTDSNCVGAIAEVSGNERFVDAINGLVCPTRIALDPAPIGWNNYEAALEKADTNFSPPELLENNPAMLPYTSGSTGKPKGVVLTHAGQFWFLGSLAQGGLVKPGISPKPLVAVPLFHKNALAGAVKPMLALGGTIIIMHQFEPRSFLTALSKYNCTYTTGVPALYALLLKEKDLLNELKFPALQNISIGSAPCPVELLKTLEEAFGVPVNQGYGLTEGGPIVFARPSDGTRPPVGSCGKPLPGVQVKLVDADNEAEGNFGELWVKSPGVTPGYYNSPGVNKLRLIDGWLKTGDLFSCDDNGFYFFRGRTDDMFVCGGENIYPIEVENALISHPDVVDASVVPIPHPIKGMAPAALVVKAADSALTVQELKSYYMANQPVYAHPRVIIFANALPLSGVGKVDRNAVRTQIDNAPTDDV